MRAAGRAAPGPVGVHIPAGTLILGGTRDEEEPMPPIARNLALVAAGALVLFAAGCTARTGYVASGDEVSPCPGVEPGAYEEYVALEPGTRIRVRRDGGLVLTGTLVERSNCAFALGDLEVEQGDPDLVEGNLVHFRDVIDVGPADTGG